MNGLDITIVPLSLLKHDNVKLRIDAGYFSKRALTAVEAIEGVVSEKFGDIVSVFRKGIFDIKADTYSEHGNGVPFVRIGDLKGGLVNKDSTEWISLSAHQSENKTRLTYGDIILSKTAYPAACFVNLEECNVSQDIIAVQLSHYGKTHFKEGYIVAFLNSRFGMPLMEREFQGNVQQHLSLDDGKKLQIPKISIQVQALIDRLFRLSDSVRDSARFGLQEAEQALLSALGLADWAPSSPLTYSAKYTGVLVSGRLDAQFYAPRIQQLVDRLSQSGSTVEAVAKPRHERFNKERCETFNYIEIGDVDAAGTARSSCLECDEAPSRATWLVCAGDVITSTVRPIRRLSAQIMPEQTNFVCSSGFVVLQPINVSPEVLLTFLRLPVISELMDLYASASMYPAISEADILAIPFPTIQQSTSDTICVGIQQSRAARQRSQEMLNCAERAVEIVIEDSEAAAISYLNQVEGE